MSWTFLGEIPETHMFWVPNTSQIIWLIYHLFLILFLDPEPKSVKHDPVRLYQFYQDQWKKQRLPGELNRTEKDLRWATREWMMGGPKT